MKDNKPSSDLSHILDKVNDIKQSVEKIDKKLDNLEQRLSKQDITLARNTDSLEYHIKRTNIAETKLDSVEKDVLAVKVSYKTVVVVASVVGAIIGIVISLIGKGIL